MTLKAAVRTAPFCVDVPVNVAPRTPPAAAPAVTVTACTAPGASVNDVGDIVRSAGGATVTLNVPPSPLSTAIETFVVPVPPGGSVRDAGARSTWKSGAPVTVTLIGAVRAPATFTAVPEKLPPIVPAAAFVPTTSTVWLPPAGIENEAGLNVIPESTGAVTLTGDVKPLIGCALTVACAVPVGPIVTAEGATSSWKSGFGSTTSEKAAVRDPVVAVDVPETVTVLVPGVWPAPTLTWTTWLPPAASVNAAGLNDTPGRLGVVTFTAPVKP